MAAELAKPATTAKQAGLKERIEAMLQPALAHTANLREESPHQGPRRRIHHVQIVASLIGLFIHLEGSLGQITLRLYHMPVSDSALSQRRARMGSELFAQISRHVLGPLADVAHHSRAFFKGLLLVGIDASKWSLPNTSANARVPKARTRRGPAAFAKLLMSTLVELI